MLISPKYIMFLFFSVLFNLPKFFEVTCVYYIVRQEEIKVFNETTQDNDTIAHVNITSDMCHPKVATQNYDSRESTH